MSATKHARPSLSVFDTSWWTADRVVAVVGTAVAVVGLVIGVWQLVRTRRAAEAARVASRATHRVLRTSDLRRALEVSLEVGRRINAERSGALAAHQFNLNDWLTAAHRIFALVRMEAPSPRHQTLIDTMEQARAEVLVARSAATTADAWRRYDRGELRAALIPYGDEAEAMIVSGDERLVDDSANRHPGV